MAQIKPQEIADTKLFSLGFELESAKGARCVFVKRSVQGKPTASVLVENGYIVSAEGLPKDEQGQYIFFRRINRVKNGKVVSY